MGDHNRKGKSVFTVQFYVDDKRLGAALLALVGIAHGQPSVVPVVNVKKKPNGSLAPKAEGSTIDRFIAALQPHKGKTIQASDVRAMMKPLGMSDKSYSYLLKKALNAKLVRKSGKGQGTSTRYEVL